MPHECSNRHDPGAICEHIAAGASMSTALPHFSKDSCPDIQGTERALQDAILFRPGEPRTHLYLIEQGVVALYRKVADGRGEILEFAFKDDVVGYGLLDTHFFWAHAVGKVRVRCLPLDALDETLRRDKRTLDRCSQTLQQEFECRRDGIANPGRRLVNRLAALLLAVSAQGRYEGRDPTVITDSLECQVVAGWLGVTLNELAEGLLELERLGLVEQGPLRGLRLTDLPGLEGLTRILRPTKKLTIDELQKYDTFTR
jgi:CRP/FNR family transcriptional regulator